MLADGADVDLPMIAFLVSQPLWLSGFLLVGLTTALAMSGPIMVRRFVALEHLSTNNEVAGFKFATVGVLYAVLLAFATIVVWERFTSAEAVVGQEAGASANIYRLSHGINEQSGSALRTALTTYLDSAIKADWPAMDRRQSSAETRHALDAVYASLFKEKDSPFLADILRQLDLVTQSRRARLNAAEGSVPSVMWFVLFGGGVATLGFTFFFGTRNLRAQVLMTGILSFLIFSELLMIVTIDRPFSGPIKVEPGPLVDVLADFGRG